MLVKILIIITMLVIFAVLISGLVFLVRDQGHTKRTVKALSWRIGLSLALFFLLFVAFSLGLIQPHGV